MPELDERIAHYIESIAPPVTGEEARSRVPRALPRRRTRTIGLKRKKPRRSGVLDVVRRWVPAFAGATQILICVVCGGRI